MKRSGWYIGSSLQGALLSATWQFHKARAMLVVSNKIATGISCLRNDVISGCLRVMLLVLFTSSIAHANFKVEPLKLSINLDTGFGTIIVTNLDQKQTFFIEITEGEFGSTTKDLSYSPRTFVLMPDKYQIVRIMLRPKVDYTGKSYTIQVRTDEDNPFIAGKPNAFKIPISICNVFPDDLELMRQRDLQDAESKAYEIKTLKDDTLEELTEIKISVPVKAIVE